MPHHYEVKFPLKVWCLEKYVFIFIPGLSYSTKLWSKMWYLKTTITYIAEETQVLGEAGLPDVPIQNCVIITLYLIEPYWTELCF